jgi:hypothetical protein
MARTNIDQLSSNAYVWIFGISPALDPGATDAVLRRIDGFLDGWASHGTPIVAARDLREGSFLIIAADESRDRSGCSIDRLFGTLKELEQEKGVQILNPDRIFFRDDAQTVRAVPRHQFSNVATPETVVFDVLADTLGEVRTGQWEKRAADSWHRELL